MLTTKILNNPISLLVRAIFTFSLCLSSSVKLYSMHPAGGKTSILEAPSRSVADMQLEAAQRSDDRTSDETLGQNKRQRMERPIAGNPQPQADQKEIKASIAAYIAKKDGNLDKPSLDCKAIINSFALDPFTAAPALFRETQTNIQKQAEELGIGMDDSFNARTLVIDKNCIVITDNENIVLVDQNGKLMRALPVQEEYITALTKFDENILVVGFTSGRFNFINITTGEEIDAPDINLIGQINHLLQLSPSKLMVASVNNVMLYDTTNGTSITLPIRLDHHAFLVKVSDQTIACFIPFFNACALIDFTDHEKPNMKTLPIKFHGAHPACLPLSQDVLLFSDKYPVEDESRDAYTLHIFDNKTGKQKSIAMGIYPRKTLENRLYKADISSPIQLSRLSQEAFAVNLPDGVHFYHWLPQADDPLNISYIGRIGFEDTLYHPRSGGIIPISALCFAHISYRGGTNLTTYRVDKQAVMAWHEMSVHDRLRLTALIRSLSEQSLPLLSEQNIKAHKLVKALPASIQKILLQNILKKGLPDLAFYRNMPNAINTDDATEDDAFIETDEIDNAEEDA